MLMPKMANNGEIGRLKFTCRFPHKIWCLDIKYMPLPIDDDETLSNVLSLSNGFPLRVEINVQLEYTYGQDQMMLFGSSSFVEMLSQETLPTSEQPLIPFIEYSSQNEVLPPRYANDIGRYSTSMLGCDVLRTSNEGPNADGPSLGREFVCKEDNCCFKILPLLFAIIDEETTEAWKWFLVNMRIKVCPGRKDVTLISDRALGIMAAVRWVWETLIQGQPLGYHRWCIRHIASNFNNAVHNTKLKDLLTRACSAHQKRKLSMTLEEIKILNADVFKWIQNLGDPSKWALFHDEGRR
ncbi:hypothetical protein Vadar_016225 [Vaccinium darrowii]|uniref:Uncharacterized protein n=1 Tax=Vaccinium darrowii TaxID=229202 RepID=A0ACB7Y772_9ERIC|nr:hypothetical protein Vadar_016225 [Vaccinium darrowii]